MDNVLTAQLKEALNELAAFPDTEFDRIIPVTYPAVIKKNDFFVRAGEIQPCLCYIISGVFRCYYIDENGAEYTKHFFRDNDFMAANRSSRLDRETEYFFQALEDATVLLMDVTKAGEASWHHPCWGELAARLFEHVHEIEEDRIRQLMLADAETRYRRFLANFPGIADRIKQVHIASYLGISPVSLSRIRAKLKN